MAEHCARKDLNHVFFRRKSGSEANDTNIRLVRTYWAEKGQAFDKNIIISRKNAYHGSSMLDRPRLGGMAANACAGRHSNPGHVHPYQPTELVGGRRRYEHPMRIRPCARAANWKKPFRNMGEDRDRCLHRRTCAGRRRRNHRTRQHIGLKFSASATSTIYC